MKQLLFVLGVLVCITATAQKQNNNWCMGRAAGVDFNTAPPTAFTSKMDAIESAAAISDKNTGALLFYSDGVRIWDATHSIMQNGDTIGTDFQFQTTPQGVVIIPFIDDANKYYVFNMSVLGRRYSSLYYSVVDMQMNNGLGAVVPEQKSVLVDTGLAEAILAIPGCGNVWLLTQQQRSGDFLVYSITEQGLDRNPVVSTLEHAERPSDMAMYRVSHDNRTIASSGVVFSGARDVSTQYMSIQDFDVMTGKVSNNKIVEKGSEGVYYDFEFSPNNRFLYASSESTIYQYDLVDRSAAAIKASRKNVTGTVWSLTGLQLGADGNIYIAKYEKDSLAMISNSDVAFPACVFTYNALKIGGKTTYKFPANIAYPLMPVSLTLGDDTMLCSGASIMLGADPQPQGTAFVWSTGDTIATINVSDAGIYTLSIDNGGCKASDEVEVFVRPAIGVDLGQNITICKDDTLLLPLSATVDTTTKFRWQDGSSGRTFTVKDAGIYSVTIANVCDTITKTIEVTERNCHFFFPSAFSPNGDGLNDIARMVGDVSVIEDYSLRIFNRWGEAVFQTENAGKGWDGYYKGQKGEVGTYYYLIKYTYDGKDELLKGDLMLVR